MYPAFKENEEPLIFDAAATDSGIEPSEPCSSNTDTTVAVANPSEPSTSNIEKTVPVTNSSEPLTSNTKTIVRVTSTSEGIIVENNVPVPEHMAARWQWQRYKDDLNRDKVVSEQIEMIKSLISNTENDETRLFAEYELTRFEGIKAIYLQTVVMNIAKLIKLRDTSNLMALPEYPKLSAKFLDLFLEEMNKQQKPSESGFDRKVTCFLCRADFQEGEETVVCQECKSPAHTPCAQDWKNGQKALGCKKETCGYCRAETNV